MFLLVSTISSNQNGVSGLPVNSLANVASASELIAPSKDAGGKNGKIENMVRIAYSDAPILIEVAKCESHFTQFTKSGNVFRGEALPSDVGVMQINEGYHDAQARQLGFDIYTIDGNLAFAKALYERYGDDPWTSSSKCWKKAREIARN